MLYDQQITESQPPDAPFGSVLFEYVSAVLPTDVQWQRTPLIVLRAYFDDSGTHDGSEVVLMAGVYAPTEDWIGFEHDWRLTLADPLGDGSKPPLKRFHMYDCEHGQGEFTSYSRPESDVAIHAFRQVILDHKLRGYAAAVPRRLWDEMVTGDVRTVLGDAERYCVMCSILESVDRAKELDLDKNVLIVFDNRPHRTAMHEIVLRVCQSANDWAGEGVTIFGPNFLPSDQILPLQAADIVAWEYYRHASQIVQNGQLDHVRPHFARLIETDRFELRIVDRGALERMIARNSHDQTKAQADHLRAYGLT